MAKKTAVLPAPPSPPSHSRSEPEGEQAVKSSRLKKSEKHSSWHAINSVLAAEALQTLPAQHGPLKYRKGLTAEQIQQAEQAEQDAIATYKAVYDEVRRGVQQGAFRSLMSYLPFYRWVLLRDLLTDPQALYQLDDLSWVAQQGDKEAQGLLRAVLSGLFTAPISGRPEELTKEKRETIAADYAKWHPMCQKLKKALIRLRQEPEWRSNRFRKEALGILARKYSLADGEIQTIVSLPVKTTPWQMTMRLLTGKYRCGEKTVENIVIGRKNT